MNDRAVDVVHHLEQLDVDQLTIGVIKENMNKFQLIAALAVAITLLEAKCLLADQPAAKSDKPNIVVIFADDLGYGDVSCYGAKKIATPNIDRLATQGLRMTDAHAPASVCSPSRYGLVTGRSPWRLRKVGNSYAIQPERLTLAGFLRDSDYKSAAIGKWHLGYSEDWNKLPITGPLEHGFDYHFGVPSNHNDPTRAFIENHDLVGRKAGVEYREAKKGGFPEGLDEFRVEDQVDTTLTKKAVEFIRRNAENRFFLYFTPCAPHTHVTPAAEFRGTSQAGLFGDHVQELDAHVGEVLATLDELKLTDNTLVIFTSDNGAGTNDYKGTKDVQLNLAVDSHDIRTKFNTAKEDAKKMGHVANGPWRDGKNKPYEGGHRVPFIARWPGKIAAGTTSDCLVTATDLYATAAEIVDRDLPSDAAVDSFSILPVLMGQQNKVDGRGEVFILGSTRGNEIAVCTGKWKMIVRVGKDAKRGHLLYDLSKDPKEEKNLVKKHAKVAARLLAAYEKAAADGRTRP